MRFLLKSSQSCTIAMTGNIERTVTAHSMKCYTAIMHHVDPYTYTNFVCSEERRRLVFTAGNDKYENDC